MTHWLDTPTRYGRISRGFHWLMAVLFAWQFAGALLYVSLGDTPLTRFVGGSHFTMGFVLFVLVLLRGSWGLMNLKRRPGHEGPLGRAAAAGHAALYALMIFVPGLALLRQYGSGKGFSPFGITLMSPRPEKIEWLMAPANLLHYWLGFSLMALIAGHIVMGFVHHALLKDGVLKRMA
ncbi:cytochrome b [Enterovirga sp.]|mgnify:CR=1 FL=1|uniref:cytochrome b n=1 Tax=Enterovirga sp. TaxID=2026350 RepID=UPI002B8551F0|nr:cytochrome b [Enterovirga sp.]HMO29027.1 cytochrome b [Enterovirga sp.]